MQFVLIRRDLKERREGGREAQIGTHVRAHSFPLFPSDIYFCLRERRREARRSLLLLPPPSPLPPPFAFAWKWRSMSLLPLPLPPHQTSLCFFFFFFLFRCRPGVITQGKREGRRIPPFPSSHLASSSFGLSHHHSLLDLRPHSVTFNNEWKDS